MKRNIKRLSLALLALGLSAPVLAASSPFCVTIPNQQGGFTVGADLLWLRPTANTNFVIVENPAVAGLTEIDVSSINPSYHWAFDLMAAYRIPCTGNDISALWTHLSNTSDSDDVATSLTVPGAAPIPVTVGGTVNYKYDAVDLDLGQRVNFGNNFNFRIFAGVRGVNTEESYNRTVVVGNPAVLSAGTTLDQDTKFKGIGPQLGIEGRYCLGYGFGIDAGTTLSALVGRTDSSATYTSFIDSFVTSVRDVSADSKNHVVPALDLNLGADYTFNFNNCSRSSLVIQAGYKAIHYWDAHNFLVSTVNSATFTPAAGINNASSMNFDGPYLGLKVNV